MKLFKQTLAAVMISALTLAPAASALYDENASVTPPADGVSITNISAPIVMPINSVPSLKLPDNILVPGTIEEALDGSLRIVNANENADIPEIVVHIGEQTRILDAVTGDPVSADELLAGDFVYVYTNSFMTMSLPPQSGAQLILCNAPQDFAVPTYHTVREAEMSDDGESVTFTTDKGETFTFTADVALTPYMTRNMVYLFNIVPGAQLLIWQNAEPGEQYTPTKAMLFAYGYNGYFTLDGETLGFNGEQIDLRGAPILTGEYGETLLPLRAVCEALGWLVEWNGELRSVTVSRGGDIFILLPGEQIAAQSDTEVMLSIAPVIINDLTMVTAIDLAYLLNIYF